MFLFDRLDFLVEVLSLTFDVGILVVFGALLANFELDFEGVERLHDRLVSLKLVFLLALPRYSLFLHELLLAKLGFAAFEVEGTHPPFIHLLHVRLELLDRLELESALVLPDFIQSGLALLIEQVRLLHLELRLVLQLLLHGLLTLLSLLQLFLQSVKVFAHSPVDVDLTPLELVVR